MKTLSPTPAASKSSTPLPGAPPADIPASELVALLTTLPRPHKIVPYPRKLPGTDKPITHIAVVAATIQDKIFAQAAAHQYTREVLSDPTKKNADGTARFNEADAGTLGYEGVFKNACAIELLSRACKAVKRKGSGSDASDFELNLPLEPAFPGATWMRKTCTDDEIGVLTAAYLRAQREIGPIVWTLSEAERDLWLEKLIKGGSRGDPLDSLALGELIELVMRSVFHLRNYRTANSSSGRPHGNGSTDSESSSDPGREERGVPPEVDLDAPPEIGPLPVDEPDGSAKK